MGMCTYLQINGQVQALCKHHKPVHFTAQGDDKTKSSSAPGLRCVTCADLQSWFCHYIMKSKGSHGSMSLALRSYGSSLELALFTFFQFLASRLNRTLSGPAVDDDSVVSFQTPLFVLEVSRTLCEK